MICSANMVNVCVVLVISFLYILGMFWIKQLKGRVQEHPLDFLLKSKMAKTAPNVAWF